MAHSRSRLEDASSTRVSRTLMPEMDSRMANLRWTMRSCRSRPSSWALDGPVRGIPCDGAGGTTSSTGCVGGGLGLRTFSSGRSLRCLSLDA